MMLRVAAQKLRPAVARVPVRSMATTVNVEQLLKECGADPRRWEMATGKDFADFDPAEVKKLKTEKGALIVHNVAYSLEWVLSSPPPLHAFLESPIIVEWPEGEDTHH